MIRMGLPTPSQIFVIEQFWGCTIKVDFSLNGFLKNVLSCLFGGRKYTTHNGLA